MLQDLTKLILISEENHSKFLDTISFCIYSLWIRSLKKIANYIVIKKA